MRTEGEVKTKGITSPVCIPVLIAFLKPSIYP